MQATTIAVILSLLTPFYRAHISVLEILQATRRFRGTAPVRPHGCCRDTSPLRLGNEPTQTRSGAPSAREQNVASIPQTPLEGGGNADAPGRARSPSIRRKSRWWNRATRAGAKSRVGACVRSVSQKKGRVRNVRPRRRGCDSERAQLWTLAPTPDAAPSVPCDGFGSPSAKGETCRRPWRPTRKR
jgi:hypothetical protein